MHFLLSHDFCHHSKEIYLNPIFILLIGKFKILHSFPKSFIIYPNFNLILSNEITVGVNRKFFALALNSPKEIAANQDNHAEWSLLTAIPTSIGNNYYCPWILIIRSQSSYEYFLGVHSFVNTLYLSFDYNCCNNVTKSL